LGKAGFATLNVYNVLGQKVATLVSGNLQAGTHAVDFNAANLSTGVYIYRLEANDNVAIKKMILLK
jgi:Secretion system C-terminal sorting domain